SAPVPVRQRVLTATTTATAAAGVAAALVFALFAVLPFLRAPSGAAGAFLATFIAVLVLRRR
ncbi:MAG: hypothetical protein M3P48_05410, partial [Actinomycetota bacterium]|nr:hypothetical protein [Actinomycetota bacterium]